MKTFFLTLSIVFCANVVRAQTVGPEYCVERAMANYPSVKQRILAERTAKLETENISKTLLPQASLNVQASMQSDVVSIPIRIPGIEGIPKISKDQYRATLDLVQVIWDGGTAKALKEIAKTTAEIESQSVEVEIYPLREQVSGLYFGILTIEERLKQLDLLNDNLSTSLKTAESMFKNGVAVGSDVDLLKLEILNAAQNKTELESLKTAYLEILSLLTGLKLESSMLQKPEAKFDNPSGETANRPEMRLFARQTAMLDARENMIRAKNMPKFNVFAQGGYGKPGFNMLSDRFEFFGIGGVKMSWNFGNLYTKNNEKRALNIDREKIKNREETLKFNIDQQLIRIRKEIETFGELMKNDDEIIRLRENVRQEAEKKYNNGVYSVNELIRDINAENLAKSNKALHEMQYLTCIYKFKTMIND